MKPGIDYIGVSVGALILNQKGEIFLTKRGKNATNERGTWEIPGGKVHFGETDLMLTYQFPAQDHLIPHEKQHWVPTSFIATIKGGQKPKILEPDKCESIGWFSLNSLPKPLSIITKLDVASYRKHLAKRDVNVV